MISAVKKKVLIINILPILYLIDRMFWLVIDYVLYCFLAIQQLLYRVGGRVSRYMMDVRWIIRFKTYTIVSNYVQNKHIYFIEK